MSEIAMARKREFIGSFSAVLGSNGQTGRMVDIRYIGEYYSPIPVFALDDRLFDRWINDKTDAAIAIIRHIPVIVVRELLIGYWKKLSKKERKRVLEHESLHIKLSHAYRKISKRRAEHEIKRILQLSTKRAIPSQILRAYCRSGLNALRTDGLSRNRQPKGRLIVRCTA
jgi:hypothetical protein